MSNDKVFFYAHLRHLLRASHNNFNDLLPAGQIGLRETAPVTIACVQEDAQVINIVLHCIYGLSCEQFRPSLDVLSGAIDSMRSYDISVDAYASPHQALFQVALSQGRYDPINFYALAAKHGLEDLAVALSSHLLSFNFSLLTDELVLRMGAVYLRRLFFLQQGRIQALKRLLLQPPDSHSPIASCTAHEQQQTVTRVWATAMAHLIWDVRPGERIVSYSCLWIIIENMSVISLESR